MHWNRSWADASHVFEHAHSIGGPLLLRRSLQLQVLMSFEQGDYADGVHSPYITADVKMSITFCGGYENKAQANFEVIYYLHSLGYWRCRFFFTMISEEFWGFLGLHSMVSERRSQWEAMYRNLHFYLFIKHMYTELVVMCRKMSSLFAENCIPEAILNCCMVKASKSM